jgi:asparagine synthetase B (glutamine-hydrolysing)
MFFSAYLGTDAGMTGWHEKVSAYGQWLDLTVGLVVFRFGDSTNLSVAWLDHRSAPVQRRFHRTDQHLLATSFGDVGIVDPVSRGTNMLDSLNRTGVSNAIRIVLSLSDRRMSVAVPVTTPEQCYFVKTRDGYVLGDDLRFFPCIGQFGLDSRAVYSLLQFGAIPPPLSLYSGVQRIPNGHVLELQLAPDMTRCTPYFSPRESIDDSSTETPSSQRVQQVLDDLLSSVPRSTVLYFSGGVDSGLLASLLARHGRTDVQLLQYVQDDEERLHAQQMASFLGLECQCIPHDDRIVPAVLDRIGRDYSFPFCDFSTIPTNVLVHASLSSAASSHTVVEGTGADGAFGIAVSYPQWNRVYASPASIRKLAGGAYRWSRLWKHKSMLERFARFLRKSTSLPLAHAVMAQNALDGIAYFTPAEIRASLRDAISNNLEVLGRGQDPMQQVSLLDLVWVCAGRMAAKSFDPLRRHGIRAIYPFLEAPMVYLSSVLPWREKCADGVEKSILKSLLAQHVPPALVYRRKRGFSPPYRRILASPAVQEFINYTTLAHDNPLLDYLNVPLVEKMVQRVRRGKSLSVGAYDFLWILSFMSGWMRQVPNGLRFQEASSSVLTHAAMQHGDCRPTWQGMSEVLR